MDDGNRVHIVLAKYKLRSMYCPVVLTNKKPWHTLRYLRIGRFCTLVISFGKEGNGERSNRVDMRPRVYHNFIVVFFHLSFRLLKGRAKKWFDMCSQVAPVGPFITVDWIQPAQRCCNWLTQSKNRFVYLSLFFGQIRLN